MSRVKSTVEYQSIQVGADSQWLHIATNQTGRTTISPRDTGSIVILVKIIINKKGSSTALTLTDSKSGIIAILDPTDAGAGGYQYNLPMAIGASLFIDNTGGCDLTVVFKDR